MENQASGISADPKSEIRNPKSTDYRVQLDAYAGPLDLLLHLVKRHEIDLNDIPIAQLTEQYLDHLRVIESLASRGGFASGGGGGIDVDKAGEFLVMAATLVEIKSAMLMPRLGTAEGGDDENQDAADAALSGGGSGGGASGGDDPRFELVQQLLAYKRFKDASLALEDRYLAWENRFPAVAGTPKPVQPSYENLANDEADASKAEGGGASGGGGEVEIDLEDVNIMDLCSAFGRMIDSIGFTGDHEVTYDDTPISLHADDIADRLERDGDTRGMTLRQIFVGRSTRSEMIGLFLATLELVRQRRVQVIQDANGGDIRLKLRPESDRDDLADADDQAARGHPEWRDPATGEIDYDWPDEATKRRAEKRAKLRVLYAAKGESPPEDADEDPDEFGTSPSDTPEADFSDADDDHAPPGA